MIAPVVYAALAGVVAVCVAVVVRTTREPAAAGPVPRRDGFWLPPAQPPWPAVARPVETFTPWPDGPAGQGARDLTRIELAAFSARQKAAADRPEVWRDDTGSFAAVHFGGQR